MAKGAEYHVGLLQGAVLALLKAGRSKAEIRRLVEQALAAEKEI